MRTQHITDLSGRHYQVTELKDRCCLVKCFAGPDCEYAVYLDYKSFDYVTSTLRIFE